MDVINSKDQPYARIVSKLFPDAEFKAAVRLAGGVSAEVYRLDLLHVDNSLSSIVLRVCGRSHSRNAADLEYQLLQALHTHGVLVPEPLLVDTSGDVLSDPYLLMAFVEGTSGVPDIHWVKYVDAMADTLASIHAVPADILPALPVRVDPVPESLDYLPTEHEWQNLRTYLRSLSDTSYQKPPKLLHGDFWPMNVLWQRDTMAAVIDWEDAAVGDPLSDVACCLLELRYLFGWERTQRFTEAYTSHRSLDRERLALWQVYVAAAATRFMSEWGLTTEREAHMRSEALACIREATEILLGQSAG